MENNGLKLVAPRAIPPLDPGFCPAVLANRAFAAHAASLPDRVCVRLALEQAEDSVSHCQAEIFPEHSPQAGGNFTFLERLVKYLLWSRGGFRIHFSGPSSLAGRLRNHFYESATGRFDSNLVGERVYGRPIEIVSAAASAFPAARITGRPLGRHLEGCRIGFDLGASDRKVAAVRDGRVVFSQETVWDPGRQPDPQYHFDGIMESLRRAAAQLPRVDAIGGSAAGIYVENRVQVASLFRSVPAEVFDRRVRDIFLEIRRAWNGIPFEVVNDGEVTALAGSMALGRNAVFGLALGSSLAAGYVNRSGHITSWLNELAFAPVDYRPDAPRDEWSGDSGLGVQYLSQQAVSRLLQPAGIQMDPRLSSPERLQHAQQLMAQGDGRAQKVYETLGTYLGYAIAQHAGFYDFDHVLILGRVTSGPGGDLLLERAKEVLRLEFPDLANRIAFHVPDEKDRRHGQAIAAASLPAIP